ncbi:MAG TPA: SOS response-associated peptidase [Deltaproteobacteria bacterium]|nr:SOS response-associated peptidase [Deltaproteobacteria bacterium]
MCGRYVLISNIGQIAEEFNLNETGLADLNRGDVYPGKKASCIVSQNNETRLTNFLWGFHRAWKKHAPKPLINARAETISDKPTFQESFYRRRCLIAADGFYEWSKDRNQFYFSMLNSKPFGLAGIYEQDVSPSTEASFVIITTSANKLVRQIHNRMPVIIPREKYPLWLDNSRFDKSALTQLFVPFTEENMQMREGTLQHYSK